MKNLALLNKNTALIRKALHFSWNLGNHHKKCVLYAHNIK
jgi:hypothetical protein